MAVDLSRFPRFELVLKPTPLHPLRRLSKALGGPTIWMKRDDMTGTGAGGNKLRKLEFLIGDALQKGCNTVVTIGAIQSNHTRQTAAAAAMAGLSCHIVQERWVEGLDDVQERVGNILLSRIFGADIEILDGKFLPGEGDEPNVRVDHACETLRQNGRLPYAIPRGASDHPLGGLGYIGCVEEIAVQAHAEGFAPTAIVHASSSGSTQAGLVVGSHLLDAAIPIIGVDVNADANMTKAIVRRIAGDTADLLGQDRAAIESQVVLETAYCGPAYGIPAAETMRAISLIARTEGIVLDPVYEGKSMAGLIDMISKRRFGLGDHIVYMHLGGDPAIHAYADKMTPAFTSAASVQHNQEDA